MKRGMILGIGCAVALHVAVLLFGGVFFKSKPDHGTLQKVDLLSDKDLAEDKKKPKEQPIEDAETMKSDSERPPDAAEVVRNIELSEASKAPKLEAASLGAIEAALNGLGSGGGDFADALSFASGGVIGGTGKAGAGEQDLNQAFNMAEIDQKPRVTYQSPPVYPAAMRSVEGVVTVILIVGPTGKVANLRVEKSTHREFEKPALDAVKQWKFEPAVKAGQRVPCNMRVPIRFQPRQ